MRLTPLLCLCVPLSVGCATSAPAKATPAPVSTAADSTSNENLELAFDPHAYEAQEVAKNGRPQWAPLPEPAKLDLAHSVGNCDAKCLAKQRKALATEYQKRKKAKDLRGAAKVALKEVHLLGSLLPEGERLYARTDRSEEACRELEEKEGAGACRKLELELFSQVTYRDFSRAKASGEEGLSAGEVKVVNDHFSSLISQCLEARARQLTPPDYERHGVHWTVRNDGRVVRVVMDRNRDDGSELSRCFSEKLAVFRYPRFAGEQQNLSQAFLIQASERHWR